MISSVLFALTLLTVALLLTRFFLSAAAIGVDRAQAQRLLSRGANVVADSVETLQHLANDRAKLIQIKEDGIFDQESLPHIDALLVYNSYHVCVKTFARNTDGTVATALPDDLASVLNDYAIKQLLLSRKPHAGLIQRKEALWVLVWQPSFQSNKPSDAAILLGKRIDDHELQRLAKMIDPSLKILAAVPEWPANEIIYDFFSPHFMLGRTAVKTFMPNERILLELTMPRVAFAQISNVRSYLFVWIAIFGIVTCVLTILLLQKWVLGSVTSSVKALQKGLAQAGRHGISALEISPPAPATSDDEMKALFDAVNAALTAIEQSSQEADRRRQEAMYAQRLAALGTLAAGVAHEINNPNGIIKLNQEVLRREIGKINGSGKSLPDKTDQQELLTIIDETLTASERIAAIVSSLKNFANPTSGAQPEPLNIAELIAEAVHWTRHECAAAKCKIASHLQLLEQVRVMGQRSQILQLFVNLLQNAYQAAMGPEMLIEIGARVCENEKIIDISIKDYGRGMRKDDIGRVLDPFFTTRRGEGGTGLGLSISAAIVKSHGGRIGIASEPGKGCEVTITLPYV